MPIMAFAEPSGVRTAQQRVRAPVHQCDQPVGGALTRAPYSPVCRRLRAETHATAKGAA